jgi:hypothetical protein
MFFPLGNERYMFLQERDDQTFIHVRQFRKYGEKLYPTSDGIRLRLSQIVNLLPILDEINDNVKGLRNSTLENFKYGIGDGVYVTGDKKYPAVRIWYFYRKEDGTDISTRFGIALSFDEWEAFVSFASELKKRVQTNTMKLVKPEQKDQAVVGDDNTPFTFTPLTYAPRRRIPLRRIKEIRHASDNDPRKREFIYFNHSEDELDQSQKKAKIDFDREDELDQSQYNAKFDFEMNEFAESILDDSC